MLLFAWSSLAKNVKAVRPILGALNFLQIGFLRWLRFPQLLQFLSGLAVHSSHTHLSSHARMCLLFIENNAILLSVWIDT
jgi:hypothetical protein